MCDAFCTEIADQQIDLCIKTIYMLPHIDKHIEQSTEFYPKIDEYNQILTTLLYPTKTIICEEI